ncbi:MAG: SWIM zinc finger family protein, partial [Verrucomicrobiota bacterium]
MRNDLLQGIERFLELLPVETRRRGLGYHTGGNVHQLECVEPDRLYTAVVRGSWDYEVELEFAGNVWVSKCSCPMQYDCKHAVAAILELRQRATGGAGAPSSLTQKRNRQPPRAMEPPRLPLHLRLVENLGRELRPDEEAFVGRIQNF